MTIATGKDGSVYAVGYFQKSIDLTGDGSFTLTSAGFNTFVLKLDSTGRPLWAKNAESTSASATDPVSTCMGSDGALYVAGMLQGKQATFDGQPVTSDAVLASAFLWKLAP